MAWGAAVGGASSGLIGTAIDQGVAAHVRNQNWSRQKRILQEQIQWRVRDLRRAGLNPILAASSGLGGGASAAMSSATPSGAGTSISSGLQAGANAARVNPDNAAKLAQAKAATAQSVQATEMAENERLRRPFIIAEGQRAGADARSADTRATMLGYEVEQYKAIADILSDPVTRRQWQAKELYGGGSILSKGAGAIAGGAASVRDWWKSTQKNKNPVTPRPNRPKTTKVRPMRTQKAPRPRTQKRR